jgi:hypothetical protein
MKGDQSVGEALNTGGIRREFGLRMIVLVLKISFHSINDLLLPHGALPHVRQEAFTEVFGFLERTGQ